MNIDLFLLFDVVVVVKFGLGRLASEMSRERG